MSKLLEGLNEQQANIVKHTEGYKLVLAGAGSGKTRVLTYSIAYLVEQGMANPYNILAVSFTNKAANEMKERISKIVGATNKRDWWIGTFHGICVRILVKHGHEIGIPPHFTIADEKEQTRLIKEILKDVQEYAFLEPDIVISRIGNAKNNLVTPTDLIMSSESIDQVLGKVYAEYQDKLSKMNTLDFDDLIMKTVQLFDLVPEVRNAIQKQFKYVLVDEAQDLNIAQHKLALLFSGHHNNLTYIGDLDQGIYSWRGANISIINDFAKLPSTTLMKLEQNYRCTKTIVESANNMIKYNKNRIDKNLMTDNEIGEKIVLYTADTEYEEAGFVTSIIDYCSNIIRTDNYKDFAVLYRTNSQSKLIEDGLNKLSIPYQIVNGTSFYDRKEIKDMLAYLRIIVNPHDLLAFQRIANEPKRNVGEGALKKISDFIIENNYSVVEALDKLDGIPRLQKKAKEAMKELQAILVQFIENVDKLDPDRFIKELATAVGYFAMLDECEEEDRAINIYALADSAAVVFKREGIKLQDYVKQLSLVSDCDNLDESDNKVKLMTVHTAKGLEYTNVFVIGLEENIFPHYLSLRSDNEDDMEEERRSFYVAMTRAEKRLYLTNAEERRLFGKTVKNSSSRFLKEIPKMYMKNA